MKKDKSMENCFNCKYWELNKEDPRLVKCIENAEAPKILNSIDVCDQAGICPRFKPRGQ